MPKPKKVKHQSPLVEASIGLDRNQDRIKKPKKRTQKEIEEDDEEQRLTHLLFGGSIEGIVNRKINDAFHQSTTSKEEVNAFFELDTTGDNADDFNNDRLHLRLEEIETKASGNHDNDDKPAWIDDDDVEVNLMKVNRTKKLRSFRGETPNISSADLEKRLRNRFESTVQTTARTDWAKLGMDTIKNAEEDDEEHAESTAAPLLASSLQRLPPQTLQVVRCPDANQADPSQAAVQAVHFHPGSDPDRPLMLTAGLDKTLRFFHVASDGSDKIHGIHFPKLPIFSAKFLGDSGNVAVSGRRSFFYIYDAAAGKLDLVPRIVGREEKSLEKFTVSPDGRTIAFLGNDGYIILVDVKSRQWIADLKMNGSVRAVTFMPNNEYLLASGSDGDVYRFDLRTRGCVDRFSNEDGTITSCLSASLKHFSVGAESGVVNLYSANKSLGRKPIKSIMNLKTSADFSVFNDDGQILAFSTRREKMGLRLLHVPTATVFSNWPTSKTPLNYVWSLDFSPKSKFLAVGNDKGICLLYRLLHYYDK